MKTIEPPEDKLEDYLKRLQFIEAIREADELSKQYTNPNDPSLWDLSQIKHRLMIAETLFYRGQSESARNLLLPYVCTPNTIKKLGPDTPLKPKDVSQLSIASFVEKTRGVPMRWRLQPGEIFYSLRLLDKAKEFAETLDEERRQLDERFEQGEIEFFRTRIAHREANYEDILKHAMLAIAAFTESDANDEQSPLVQWRMGHLLLVFGSGAWRYGDPTRGTARLHLSRWLLSATDDHLGIANAKHALGNMFRAKGDYPKAEEYLKAARTIYEDLTHTLGCAKVHTSLGIYYLNQKLFGDAAREFESAMRLADQAGSKRQESEVAVWRSWLLLEEPNPKIQRAIVYGQQALALLEAVEGEHYARVEAHIAVGSAHLANDDLPKAEKSFNAALKIATEHKLKKHMVSAHLSMAELLCRLSNTKDAWHHYMMATTKILPDGKEPDSKHLCSKRDRIKTELEKGSAFYLNVNQLVKQPKLLKKWQQALAEWLIDQTHTNGNGTTKETAKLLGIPRQRVSSYLNSVKKQKRASKKRSSVEKTI